VTPGGRGAIEGKEKATYIIGLGRRLPKGKRFRLKKARCETQNREKRRKRRENERSKVPRRGTALRQGEKKEKKPGTVARRK